MWKYFLLFCVATLFVAVKCDYVTDHYNEWNQNMELGCTAECMNKPLENNLESCFNRSRDIKYSFAHTGVLLPSSDMFRLVCRDADAFVIDVFYESKYTRKGFSPLYVVEYQESGNHSAPIHTHLSLSPYVKVQNLTVDTIYNVSVKVFTEKSHHLLSMCEVRTLSSRTYHPKTIPSESIILSNFTANENPKLLSAYVQWKPADDMVCHYGMILYEIMENPENKHTFQAYDITDPKDLYKFKISNLVMGSHYHLGIQGRNTKDAFASNESSISFATPSCWEVHDFNTSLCPPIPLQNLTSTHSLVAEGVYDIDVEWEPIQPEHQPIYYTVSIFPHDDPMNTMPYDSEQSLDVESVNVTGHQNHAYLHNIQMNSVEYTIRVEAFSIGGSTLSHAQQSLKDVWDKVKLASQQESFQSIVILASAFIVLLLLVVYLLVLYRRMKLKRNSECELGDLREVLAAFRQENRDNDMEVHRTQIQLCEALGEGAFGIVHRGKLMPRYRIKFNWGLLGLPQFPPNNNGLTQSMDVAVKMLKGHEEGAKVREFLDEIKVMKSVAGQHENILNIVGHCTTGKHYSQLLLLTEYCSEGNLLDYLRAFRKPSPEDGQDEFIIQVEDSDCKRSCAVDDMNHTLFVENRGYDVLMPLETGFKPSNDRIELLKVNNNENEAIPSEDEMLRNSDLLNFAIQIASGMEFLTSRKILHRDLAARNILVCADKTMKIADFGLSRDIYIEENYTKRSDGRVPLKWLALESMVHRLYTSQSDVWSYGILLYEIVTLGCTPYPEIPNATFESLMDYLKAGYRMKRPSECSGELYRMMLDCWNSEGDQRPSFATIAQVLRKSDPNDLIYIDCLRRVTTTK